MASKASYSNVLVEAKKKVGESKEWKAFLNDLQDVTDQQLSENHIGGFLDLSDEEKIVFTDKALRATQSGARYKSLYSNVSLILDQQVNNAVAKKLQTSAMDELQSTKTELIVDELRENAVSLLRRWPEMKYKLHMYLNLPLPPTLQSVAWNFFLSNPKLRDKYVEKLMKSPQRAISHRDKEISTTCEQILKLQNTFPEIGPPSIGAFYAMKAVLSYFHSQLNSDSALHHVYYLLTLPMIQVLSKYLSKVQPATNNIVATLVEMYVTLINGLPDYVADVHSVHGAARKTFAIQVAHHLISYDESNPPGLSSHIITLPTSASAPGGAMSLPPAVDIAAKADLLADVLLEPVDSLLKSLFVDVLMFVWDQYIIGLDVADYHAHFLPAFTACLFSLLKNDILLCADRAELLSVVQRECGKLTISHVQQKIKTHHYKLFYSELNQDDKAAVPVIDPTQVTARNWTHWNNEVVPRRVGPEQRQQAREARQQERDRLLLLRQEEAKRREEWAKRQSREVGAQLRADAEHSRLRSEEDRKLLLRQLEMERLSRQQKDRQYEAELSRLRDEIEQLKRQPAAAPPQANKPISARTIRSYASAVAPPPSRMSLIPDAHPQFARPSQAKRTPLATERIAHDLISIIAKKFRAVAHGTGAENAELNRRTREDLTEHQQDIQYAQREVFGRALKPGEFDRLEEEERLRREDEMMDIVRTRLEGRRQTQLQN